MPIWLRAHSKTVLMVHGEYESPPPQTTEFSESTHKFIRGATFFQHGPIGWLCGERYVEGIPTDTLKRGPIYFNRDKVCFIDASDGHEFPYGEHYDFAEAVVEDRGPVVYLYQKRG